MLVICNFCGDNATLEDISIPPEATLILTNYPQQADHLQPFEARLYLW
jgi:hypothetical protein